VTEGAVDVSAPSTGVKPGALSALLQEVAAAPEQREIELPSLPPGTVVGRFEIVRELGRGAFGVVYEARDRELGRMVALKVVRPGRAETGESKVAREAEAISRLSHPNLVTLYDLGHSDRGPYLVFELLHGKTLHDRLADGPLPVQEAVHIAVEVARGLAHAHSEGVVHRDLKPSNVFVTNRGQVKILDFGMAHAFGRRRVSGGTPAYMAPEQWEDDPEDERTDVFALGVMLYRMLLGEYPFPEDEGRWSSGLAAAPKLDVPGATGLADLVGRCLEKAPKARPRDGAAVLAALTPIEDALRTKPADGAPPAHATRRKATLGDLLAEMNRRRVFRVMIGYGIFAFAVLQITEPIIHGAHLPEWVLTAVLVALGVGFPVAVTLAWLFDLTAQGVRRTPSASGAGAISFSRRRLAALLVVWGLVVALPGVAWYLWKQSGDRGQGLAAPVAAASIAVLPFADMSPGKDQEHFADGVAEEILNTLARLDGLKVVGRTSSFSFKGKGEAAAVIAGKLQVAHLLEGSVRRDGNRVRISAQLVSARDGFQVWGESFDRELTGVFAIQDEIARSVVNALKVKLLPGREPASAPHRPANPEVYSQYLLGLQYLRRGASDRNFRLAAEAFEKAIALDSSFAPAWANLAYPLGYFADIAATPSASAEGWKRAFAATERAISIDPFLPEAYLARGHLRWATWDWAGADADVDRVLALDPNSSKAHKLRGRICTTMGRPKEAIAELRRAIDLDPLDYQGWLFLNQPYRVLGNMGSARDVLMRSRELAPEGFYISLQFAVQSLMEGQPAVALAEFERLPNEAWRLLGTALARQSLGQAAEARQALDALKDRFADTMAYDIASLHARWGERDAAFEWLDRAYRQHDGGLVGIKIAISLQSLRDDPRYIALLRKMNLPVD